MPKLRFDRPSPFRPAAPDPRLSRTLWQWLAIGLAASLVFPDARGFSDAIGWLPFWLVVAPLASLAVLHRHRLFDWLAAARAGILVPGPRRRRHRRRAQAQRLGYGSVGRRGRLRAA